MLFCGDEYNEVHSLDVFLEKFDLDRYFSKNLKGQDKFGVYKIPEKTKERVKTTLKTQKSVILKNKKVIYRFIEDYFTNYENKGVEKISKKDYITYELYNYLYGKIKIMELSQ